MLSIKLDNGNTLSVCAEYDSGTFTGFSVCEMVGEGYGDEVTLDKILSKEQIQTVTYIIGASVKSFIDEEKS